jgi:hypothetical protein
MGIQRPEILRQQEECMQLEMCKRIGKTKHKKSQKGDRVLNKKNSEGYYDETAYNALKPIIKHDAELEKKANKLIYVMKFIASLAGFEFIGRVKIRHKESGREFK